MKVINLFGGPCTGKSTIAAGLFHEMKMKGYNIELVTEYAKDMTWEERGNILADPLYILAKQHRRISRLKGKVDYIITDSPLLLGLAYISDDYYKNCKPLLLEIFSSYDNYNFMLTRPETYSEIGRNQTLEEAKLIDDAVTNVLTDNDVDYKQLPVPMSKILSIVLSETT